MNRFNTLLLREWLQHRLSWALMLLIPLALTLLVTSFGSVEFDDEDRLSAHDLALVVALGSIAGTAALLALIASVASAFTVAGLARRDHGDRSIEYWLSLPVGHAVTFAAPLLVHLLLVPMVALLAGALGGLLVSLVMVVRVDGLSAWFALPWGGILTVSIAVAGRFLAGLPLALLWLSPLILLTVLLYAWFRRWGLVILVVLLALGNVNLQWLFGRPLFTQWVVELFRHAGNAFIYPRPQEFPVTNKEQMLAALHAAPGWALENLGWALRDLANPLLPVALLLAAGCFWALIDWRRRGAMAGS